MSPVHKQFALCKILFCTLPNPCKPKKNGVGVVYEASQKLSADHRNSAIPDLQWAAFQVPGGLQLLYGTSWYQIYAIHEFQHTGSFNLHFQIRPIQIGQI